MDLSETFQATRAEFMQLFSCYATFRVLNRVINSNSSKVALKSFVCFNFYSCFRKNKPSALSCLK